MRVYKFNTVVEFDKWGSSSGAHGVTGANPHISGVEGTACDHYGSGNDCDDRMDWDEMMAGLGDLFPSD